MNSDNLFLIERPYQEVVDDILTSIVGGVVNEPIIFDVKLDRYQLQKPAQEGRVIVTGHQLQDGEEVRRTFQRDEDYEFIPGDQAAIVWKQNGAANGAKSPIDGSTFFVDYIPDGRTSPLSDINIGSVTRTICEAVGREIATVYQQINQAYLSGFIDTAEGKSLDLVVAILGVVRRTDDFAEGFVTFFRDSAIKGAISIPTGTLLTTADRVLFQTTQTRTLQAGQARIDAPIRATNEFPAAAGKGGAGAINAMVLNIAGIERVSNVDATALGAADETDDELRERAKAALQRLGKATINALIYAVKNAGISALEIRDPNSEEGKQTPLGEVVLIMEGEPERIRRAERAVQETRAAGVLIRVSGLFVYFTPKLKVTTKPIGPAAGELKVKQEIIFAMQQYVDGLKAGDSVVGADLLVAVKEGSSEVVDPQFVEVVASRADQDNLGQRISDRSLVQSINGGNATDEEIETAQFKVVPIDEDWSVVLEIDASDIIIQEEAG